MMSLVHDMTNERQAIEEVRRLNRELEARVHERTEELAQANADMKALTYSISHDLRAPVRAVLGFGQILERRYAQDAPEEARTYLGHILRAGSQMDALIDGLMEFGRLEAESMNPGSLDPHPLVQEVIEQVEAAHPEAKGAIRIRGRLPMVRADRGALRRVLHNLVGNAIKYAGDSTPEVQVSGESNSAGVRLRVDDNGPGIPPEHRERIFRLFERMHRSDEVPGAGVGLAVVARSMDYMGGSARVEDSPMGGASFVLEFSGNGTDAS